jgi:hypothetical protein
MTPLNPLPVFNGDCRIFSKMFVSDPEVSLRLHNPNFANNYLDYLGEYEAICETAIAVNQGPRGIV